MRPICDANVPQVGKVTLGCFGCFTPSVIACFLPYGLQQAREVKQTFAALLVEAASQEAAASRGLWTARGQQDHTLVVSSLRVCDLMEMKTLSGLSTAA